MLVCMNDDDFVWFGSFSCLVLMASLTMAPIRHNSIRFKSSINDIQFDIMIPMILLNVLTTQRAISAIDKTKLLLRPQTVTTQPQNECSLLK